MKSYLKFLSRNALYTIIEALGLAISIAFVVLIASHIVQQYSLVSESPYSDRTYVLQYGGYWDKWDIELNIPEVEKITHTHSALLPIQLNDERYDWWSLCTDNDFFKVFPEYKIIEGDANDFVSKNDILVSETMARRISAEGKSVVGSTLNVDGKDKTIKGVYADFDGMFFKQCNIIMHISASMVASDQRSYNNIGDCATWYVLRQESDGEAVADKVFAMQKKNYLEQGSINIKKGAEMFFKPRSFNEAYFEAYEDNYTFHTCHLTLMRLLIAVVLLLLLSAVFNYVNLSLALTGKRAKEMATRRLLGAGKGEILWKYISESIAFTTVCFLAALVIAKLIAPMLDTLIYTAAGVLSSSDNDQSVLDNHIKLKVIITPGYLAMYMLGVLILGTINGILPAMAASHYKPIDVIKGTLRRHSKMVLSRVFIVVQSVLAVMLIAIALVMELQMKHMLTRPPHSDVDNIISLKHIFRTNDEISQLKSRIEKLAFVKAVGGGMGGFPGCMGHLTSKELEDGSRLTMPFIMCDSTYFRILNFEVIEDFGGFIEGSIWISEAAYRAMGESDLSEFYHDGFDYNPLNNARRGGVLHNFPTRLVSSNEEMPYGVIYIAGGESGDYCRSFLISTVGEDNDYLEQIRQVYHDFCVEIKGKDYQPSDFGYLRDLHYQFLEPERNTMRLVELFAVLSVLLSLLGLLAMSTYFADENTKQIAIRKVFGSDVRLETWRIVRSYMYLIGIACVVAIPLASIASRRYLENFAYRVEHYGWVFAIAALIALAIAFATVLWQTLRAAKTNPAIELKKE